MLKDELSMNQIAKLHEFVSAVCITPVIAPIWFSRQNLLYWWQFLVYTADGRLHCTAIIRDPYWLMEQQTD